MDDDKAVRLIALGLQVALGDCPFGTSIDTNIYDGNSAQVRSSYLPMIPSALPLLPSSTMAKTRFHRLHFVPPFIFFFSLQMSLLVSSLNRLDLVPPSLTHNQSPNENEKLSPALENAYAHVLAIYQVEPIA